MSVGDEAETGRPSPGGSRGRYQPQVPDVLRGLLRDGEGEAEHRGAHPHHPGREQRVESLPPGAEHGAGGPRGRRGDPREVVRHLSGIQPGEDGPGQGLDVHAPGVDPGRGTDHPGPVGRPRRRLEPLHLVG